MLKVSVITPTVRPEGLSLVARALKNQNLCDFEWIIIGPESIREIAMGFSTSGIGQRVVFLPEPTREGDVWNLNKSYNEGIRKSTTSLIVSWQDFTSAKYDTLERFYTHFKQEPNILVSAVGNKYVEVYPVPGAMVWKDPRERDDNGSYYLCQYQDIEWNLCSVPKQALYDVGGFDEEMDKMGFGMDAYSVDERISFLGKYDFKLDQTIKSYSELHGRLPGWDERNLINGGYKERQTFYVEHGPKLPYLTKE